MDITEFAHRVEEEYNSAKAKHPSDFHSTHEAYAVIQEELDEYWALVKKDSYYGWEYREELTQVAAMCFKAMKELHGA